MGTYNCLDQVLLECSGKYKGNISEKSVAFWTIVFFNLLSQNIVFLIFIFTSFLVLTLILLRQVQMKIEIFLEKKQKIEWRKEKSNFFFYWEADHHVFHFLFKNFNYSHFEFRFSNFESRFSDFDSRIQIGGGEQACCFLMWRLQLLLMLQAKVQ